MKWFYRWLGEKISDSNYSPDVEEPGLGKNLINTGRPKPQRLVSARESEDLRTEPITFKMYKASGGWAIEFRQYDNRNDRVETSLYVVNDEEELGKHISQIITMEALKR